MLACLDGRFPCTKLARRIEKLQKEAKPLTLPNYFLPIAREELPATQVNLTLKSVVFLDEFVSPSHSSTYLHVVVSLIPRGGGGLPHREDGGGRKKRFWSVKGIF